MNAHSLRSSAGSMLAGLLLALAASSADAQWWDPRPVGGRMMPPTATVVLTRADIERASVAIQRALAAGDIEKVERMHDEFLALEQAGGNGRWMMEAFGLAFQTALPGLTKDRVKILNLIAGWKERFPQSKLLPALEAGAWMASAWNARGHGYASTVSPEGMKAFRDDNARAMEVLKQSEGSAKDSPLWYEEALSVAGVTGQPDAVMDAIFDEGASRFPLYYRLYATRVNFLLPQWGGSYASVDDFVRKAVLRTQATEGTSFYAWLYGSVRRSFDGENFFKGTKASWKLMRHGFEDGLAIDDDWVWLNTYAAFACMAEDRPTLRRLLDRLGKDANFELLLRNMSQEVCMAMARE